MERNIYLEMDGLAHRSDTHEWFFDKLGTSHAQNEDKNFIKLPNLECYVVRDIKTGEYDRIILDKKKQQIVYDTKSLEDLRFYIDKLKIAKHFK